MKGTAGYALVCLLVLSSCAAAQQATTTVTIVELPPGPESAKTGETHRVPFKVNFRARDFNCAAPVEFEVALSATGQAGLSTNASPSPLVFQADPGVYGLVPMNPIQPEYNETMDATLTFTVLDTAQGGLTTVTVKAMFEAIQPQECTPTSFGSAQDQKAHTVSVEQGQGTNTTGNQSEPVPPPPPPQSTPGFDALVAVGVMAAAAVAIARRRR